MGGFVLFLIFVLLAVLAARQSRASRINAVYQRLAHRYHGELSRGGIFRMPHLRFVYKGAHVLVDTLYAAFPFRIRNRTQFHVSWPDHELQFDLAPVTMRGRFQRLLSARDIRVGNPYFDAAYRISGNNAQATREFVSAGVQAVANQIRELTPARDLRLAISDGILVIRKRGTVRDYDQLVRMISLGIELFDQAMLTRMAGIDIIGESLTPMLDGEAICKICGEGIAYDIVYCQKCRTPHHFECWQYYGACSVYGCGETKHRR